MRIGDAAELAHDLGDGLRADEVVHDLLARVALEHRRGEHRGGGRARHGLPELVDEHDAVGVAVEREAEAGVVVAHRALEVLEVLDHGGVGLVVGEGAVELAVEHREVRGQPGEDRRDDQSADAVRGVGDDPDGRQRIDVDERVDMGDERGQEIATFDPTWVLGPLEQPAGDHRLDLGESGVLADRRGT